MNLFDFVVLSLPLSLLVTGLIVGVPIALFFKISDYKDAKRFHQNNLEFDVAKSKLGRL